MLISGGGEAGLDVIVCVLVFSVVGVAVGVRLGVVLLGEYLVCILLLLVLL